MIYRRRLHFAFTVRKVAFAFPKDVRKGHFSLEALNVSHVHLFVHFLKQKFHLHP